MGNLLLHRRVLCLVAVLSLSCSVYAVAPREDRDDLSLEWAEFRRAQVASVAYDIEITLQQDADTFEGKVALQVELNQTDAPLSIDLLAEAIHTVSIDGEPIPRWTTRRGSFDIPAEYLHSGPMTILVSYTGAYTKTRDGLYRYRDQEDGREYLFTNLEPYGAHYVIPCFDQPDIKATYRLTVSAPASWHVIGNMLPEKESMEGGRKNIVFKPTPPLSTYLFFLGAGDYRMWIDEYHGLPLHLYARESLAQYFDPERLFAETKAGLDYFNEYYGTPYPFDKYGHVFAPELGPGAMENPGAVTMNEYMIFRGAATMEDYRGRNNTLLHEMAHMWFGDLVTMAWWNDLWLNESFATFSAYQAQEAIGTYSGIWERFYQTKGWAYYQDQLSTTHPVEVAVPSAQLAIANFDGITYAKGASALKQLWFTVGPEAYQRGVADYFQKYAWQNATRAQFMASIAAQTNLDLAEWTKRWLQTPGLSSITVKHACDNGTISSIQLNQQVVNAPDLSPHKTQVALFRFNELGRLVPYATQSVGYRDAEQPIPELVGQPCPDFIYPNYGDMDYGLFFLDDTSFATASKQLMAFDDPFIRKMIWGTLYSMVRHQRLGATDMMTTLISTIPRETDADTLEYLLGNRPTIDVYRRFLSPEQRQPFADEFSTLLWDGFERSAPGTDARIHWLDAYVATVSRAEDEAHLRSLLAMESDVMAIDQPRRWQVIRALAGLGATDVYTLVDEELERDPSDQGKRYAFAIRGAVPTMEAKQWYWKEFKKPELSLSLLSASARTFYNDRYPELIETFVDDWFDYVTSHDWETEQHRISAWFDYLMPPVYTEEFLARSKAALASTKLPARAHRAWQESNDELARIIAIRAYDAATPGD